jgi:hypothetical protein
MKSSPTDTEPDELYDELTNLPAVGSERLKERWRILYGTEPPPRISEDLLRRAIAHRLQERAFGGLKPSTRRPVQRNRGSCGVNSNVPTYGTRPAFFPARLGPAGHDCHVRRVSRIC